MSGIAKIRKRLPANDERGQAAVFLVLALGIFLIGGVGFVVDGANLWFHRQTAQTAADAACSAGAIDMLSVAAGANIPNTPWRTSAVSYAGFNGYTSGTLSISFPSTFSGILSSTNCVAPTPVCAADEVVTETTPPLYMQVQVNDSVPTTFMRLVGAAPSVSVPGRSVCGLSNVLSAVPILVLNPNAPQAPLSSALTADGGAIVSVFSGPQKSIQINSADPTDSIGQSTADLSSASIDLTQANGSNGGDFSVASRESKATANADGVNFGANGQWIDASGVMSDPFAIVSAPSPPNGDCSTGGGCVVYGAKTPDCPDAIDGCDIYSAGYYSRGIAVQRGFDANGQPNGAATGLALFSPGLYYLAGDLSGGSESCLRSATDGGDGSGGTMFYFADRATINVGPASGTLKRPRTSGTKFNCQMAMVSLPTAECSGGNLNLPSSATNFTGNVLMAPCTGLYGDPAGDDKARGMLFFQERDAQPANTPTWNPAGSFGLIGNIYIHHCGSATTGSGASCDSSAFNDTFYLGNLGGSGSAYVAGAIVVDQLHLGSTDVPITVGLNPNPQYYVLKASLLQ